MNLLDWIKMRIKGIKRKEQLTEDDKMNNKENIFLFRVSNGIRM